MATVVIPEKVWRKVESVMDAQQWISEEEAARIMGVKTKTLQNKASAKTLPEDCYKVSILGTRVYNRLKLVK